MSSFNVRSSPLSSFMNYFLFCNNLIPITSLICLCCSVNHWLQAGILVATNAVILCDKQLSTQQDSYQEHLVDASHILAVQKLTTLFPKVHFVTDIHYRFNVRFMYYAEKNALHTTAKSIVSHIYGHRAIIYFAVMILFE